MDVTTGPTPHKPLSPSDSSEIRLMRLYPANFNDQPRCELEHYSLTEGENQPYIALSYTWGDPKVTEPIYLDGSLYPATTNLHLFLRYAQVILLTILEVVPPAMRHREHQVSLQMLACDILEDRNCPRGFSRSSAGDIAKLVESKLREQLEYCLPGQPEEVEENMKKLYCATDDPPDTNKSYLIMWIDAVCINQRDLAERSQQVRRMKDIYTRTMKLLIWLHYPDPDLELGPYMDWVVDRADEVALLNGALKSPPDDPGLRETVERLMLSDEFQGQALKSLGIITQHPWFSRVWVIQEITCASRRATFLLGFRPLSWADLTCLWTFCHVVSERYSGMKRRLLDLRARNLGILEEISRFYGARDLLEYEEDEISSFPAQQLSLLLEQTGGAFKATDPRDVLYALLGLLGTDDIPNELVPDYTLPISHVFQSYAVYLATKAGYIEFLDTCGKQMPGGPSWVPDWTCFRRGVVDGLEPARVTPRGGVSADGSRLVFEGVRLGEVVDVIFPGHDVVTMADKGYEADDEPDNIRFSHITRAYRTLKQGCMDHWAKIMPDPSWGDFELHWTEFWAPISEDRLDLDVVEFMQDNSDRWDQVHGEGELRRRLCEVSRVIKTICAVGIAILGGGKLTDILQVDKGIERGYIVCMMKGLRMPCMLRPDGANFRFISTCGHTSFRLTDPDEAFYAVNHVEKFSLI